MRTAALALCVLFCPAVASAGPIHWSYSSTGAQDGAYGFNPAGYPLSTPAGQTELIFLVGGYGFPVFDFPVPPQGPILSTGVTITDAESGLSRTFDVAVEFYDFEPSDHPTEWYAHEPRIVPFQTFDVVLDRHRYTVSNGPDRALAVEVHATPEPGTFVMAGLGLAGIACLRRRRVARE